MIHSERQTIGSSQAQRETRDVLHRIHSREERQCIRDTLDLAHEHDALVSIADVRRVLARKCRYGKLNERILADLKSVVEAGRQP